MIWIICAYRKTEKRSGVSFALILSNAFCLIFITIFVYIVKVHLPRMRLLTVYYDDTKIWSDEGRIIQSNMSFDGTHFTCLPGEVNFIRVSPTGMSVMISSIIYPPILMVEIIQFAASNQEGKWYSGTQNSTQK